MINTSNAYKNTIKENRVIHNQVRITFADGSIKTAADTGLLQFGIQMRHQITAALILVQLLQNRLLLRSTIQTEN